MPIVDYFKNSYAVQLVNQIINCSRNIAVFGFEADISAI